ncbi:pituitary tumor-transforming gene 1 protein-interacting protein-like isoform X2 [Sphaerodactylus townsendi]|uniref:pituitary tumor-transforming gene 1 protein-interacting protein-like isoform X2 n=1 Tax=Sphaerodactylus townsendi TaxID=933632 RepID=UPI00202740E9|nr:pituitary tumor-transforming gene 1 protein-interacting protein-like isoform X2 [Sphaerodactylus townsendi]
MEAKAAAQWPPWLLCLSTTLLLCTCSAAEEATALPSPTAAQGAVGQACAVFSGKTCDECIQNTSCLWCNENSICMDYPVRSIIPSSTLCPLSEARWGVCWVNFQALIITIAVVAGLLLLSIAVCCCYCCCCRGHRGGRLAEEEERFIRDREEKRLQSLQRKHERKAKHDEIRKKYGLLQDSDHPYSRYENE